MPWVSIGDKFVEAIWVDESAGYPLIKMPGTSEGHALLSNASGEFSAAPVVLPETIEDVLNLAFLELVDEGGLLPLIDSDSEAELLVGKWPRRLRYLEDVDMDDSSLLGGQVLALDGADGYWKPRTISSVVFGGWL